jgi:hypothetical protein
VLGILLAGFLHLSAGLFRLLSNLCRYSGKCLVSIYDLLAFLPLWIESKIGGSNRPEDATEDKISKSLSNRSEVDTGSSASIKLPRKSPSRKRIKKEDVTMASQTQEVLS